MGTGIRAKVSLPTAAPSPFDGVVEEAKPITGISCCTPAADRERVVVEFIADAGLSVPDGVEVVFDYGGRAAYRFDAAVDPDSPFAVLDRHETPVSAASIRDGRLCLTFHARDLSTLRSVLETFRDGCPDMEVLRLLQSTTTPTESDLVTVDRSELTERQREVLAAAYEAGYFDHPKGANAGEVAASLGIDRSTFTEHLAAAQRKLFGALID
ncbi:MAG: helix-turn-helix domain-containing protein [Halorubrum sp.]